MKLTVQQQERIRYACGHLSAAELYPESPNADAGEEHAWEVFEQVVTEAVDAAVANLTTRVRERAHLWEMEATAASARGMTERTSDFTTALLLHASQLRKIVGEDESKDPKPGTLEYAQRVAEQHGDLEDAATEDGMDNG